MASLPSLPSTLLLEIRPSSNTLFPLPYLRNFDLLLQNLILPGAPISINKDEELCKNCKNNRVDKDTNYTGKNVPKINKNRKKEIGGK